AFVSSDPLLGGNYVIPYSQFDNVWIATGNTFIVIYPPSSEPLLAAVLAANNWSASAHVVSPVSDRVPPKTTVRIAGASNPDGSYGGSVTATFSATDNASGVAQTTFSV